jgi:hypothetical protein
MPLRNEVRKSQSADPPNKSISSRQAQVIQPDQMVLPRQSCRGHPDQQPFHRLAASPLLPAEAGGAGS